MTMRQKQPSPVQPSVHTNNGHSPSGEAVESATRPARSESRDVANAGAAADSRPARSCENTGSAPKDSSWEDDIRDIEAATRLEYARQRERDLKKIEEAARRLTLHPNDVIIAVMGITGVGKSTFIELLTSLGIKIGKSLRSCTMEVGIHPFKHRNGQTIYLIDTPGFDDTDRTDTETLEDLAHFLGATYLKDIKLAGIIYLHSIADNRIKGSNLKNFTLFQQLCGTDSLSNVVLATTMWDTRSSPALKTQALEWEDELRNTPEFWGDMIDMDSKMMRQDDGYQSAIKIIDYILALRKKSTILTIQREIIDDEKPLYQTNAGREVQKEVIKLNEQHNRDLQRIQEETKSAIKRGDERLANKLSEMQTKYTAKLSKTNKDMIKLKADFKQVQKDKEEQHRQEMDAIRAQSKQYEEAAKRNLASVDELAKRQKASEDELTRIGKEKGEDESKWRDELAAMKRKHEGELDDLRQAIREKNEELQNKADDGFARSFAAIGGLLTALILNPFLVGIGGAMMAGGSSGTGP